MRIARGDIWNVDLEPTRGREQQGSRPVLVVSTDVFNRMGLPLVAPITRGGSFARNAGFAVPLSGCKTDGVALCNQLRSIDLEARGARRVERAPEEVLDDVAARIAAIVGFAD